MPCAFARRRRIDRGDEDELAVGAVAQRMGVVALELGDVLAVEIERGQRDSRLLGDFGDRTQAAGAGDGEVVRHGAAIRKLAPSVAWQRATSGAGAILAAPDSP
jgi:hypothetical protein